MNELKKVGLTVYYHILKLHQKQLTPDLRTLGDKYVREEFNQAHSKANIPQYTEFIASWIQYMRELEQDKNGRDITPSEINFFTAEQIDNLKKIRVETFKKK